MVDDVRRACVAAGEPDPVDEATELALRAPGHGGASIWVAAGGVGFAVLRSAELTLAVAPASRRQGLGRELAAVAAIAGARAAWSHGDHAGAARLASEFGFARTRELWLMRRPSSVPLPALVVPSDLRIRGFSESDGPSLLAVNAAAFASHPEQGALDAAGLEARMAEPWFDPDGLLLAVDAGSGALLGFHWTKRVPGPSGEPGDVGEVYVVGVSPAAQGRGLGRVLTLAGLHHLVDGGAAGPGVREVELYVESDNAPAIAVYSGLGFTHSPADTHVMYTL